MAYEMKVFSAHRLPDMRADHARSARESGLEGIQWNIKPPTPKLPQEIVNKAAQKYEQALKRLTADDAVKEVE
jgi:hypothetical protein